MLKLIDGIAPEMEKLDIQMKAYIESLEASQRAKVEMKIALEQAKVGLRFSKMIHSADPDLLQSIERILANGVSEGDLSLILKNAQKQLPIGNTAYNLEWLLKGLEMTGNLNMPHYDVLLNMLKKEGTLFDNAMRTLAYTARKEKWNKFDAIFAAKVGNRILNPPQGFSKESFDKLNRLIIENTGHYGGKIKAQGSKLMGASDVDEAGNFISDLDYVCEVDAKRFLEIFSETFNEELEVIYKAAYKQETNSGKISIEQVEKLLTFAKEDLSKPVGKRILTGNNRQEMKEILEYSDNGLIFNDKLRLKNGSSIEPFLKTLEKEFGQVEYTVKRQGGYNDAPFIEIN